MGVFNLLSFAIAGTGVVILCMLAVKDTVGVVVFAIFYGFFSGIGTYSTTISARYCLTQLLSYSDSSYWSYAWSVGPHVYE